MMRGCLCQYYGYALVFIPQKTAPGSVRALIALETQAWRDGGHTHAAVFRRRLAFEKANGQTVRHHANSLFL